MLQVTGLHPHDFVVNGCVLSPYYICVRACARVCVCMCVREVSQTPGPYPIAPIIIISPPFLLDLPLLNFQILINYIVP